MNITPLLKAKYPEGSVQGQCGIFAHQLVDFATVGDSYAQKKQAVRNFGILKENLAHFQIGDVVITSEGTLMGMGTGHVCTVADILNGQPLAAESNFKNDGRVHYGRAIPVNKVYGVIRGPLKIDLGIQYPYHLKFCVLMQYQKQWNSAIFQELADKVLALTGGKIQLDIYPLYTYYALKNWNYKAYFQNYNVIAKEYIDDQVMPLSFSSGNQPPQFVLWAINKAQWQGSVINSPNAQEIGWYYPNSKFATIVCDEGDMSFYNYGEKAFTDYAIHELCHFLYDWGRPDGIDLCHQHYFDRQMEKVIADIDLNRLIANI